MPQLLRSSLVSVHTPPQVTPVAQRQVPVTHAWPEGQALPQRPQLLRSEKGSAQVVPQRTPMGTPPMEQRHTPRWQAEPVGQTVPQVPQLLLLDSVSTQAAPQRTPASGSLPIAQRQTPSVQVDEAGQARPQPPQLLLSDVSDTQVPEHRVWAPGQGVTHMLSLHTWPVGQARPQAPQWFCEMRVSISQPSAGVVLQSAKPVLHAIEQRPEVQRDVDCGPATQGARQAPQLSVSVLRSDSQPLVTLPSQSPRPPAQVEVQRPREHMPMPQERPQTPQLVPLVSVFTSQPFMGFMSQSAKPAAQVTMVHAPAAQPCSATLGSSHALPQRPQCWGLVEVAVSQPVVESPSQSPKPALHMSIAQAPRRHAAEALRMVQVRRQAPQFMLSARASVSQPLVASPSQSTKPSAHSRRQAPITQAPTELVPEGQRIPQAPQLVASVWRFTSQPLVALMSQSV
jgi:hypothetical protein